MADSDKKVLFVTTSHDQIGEVGDATGLWLEEFATPFLSFREAGYEVVVASPKGGKIPIDPRSMSIDGNNPAAVSVFLRDPEACAKLETALPLAEVDFSDYPAVFFPGGHGVMWDLPGDERLARSLGDYFAAGGLIGAVCHGPAALLGARLADGMPLVANRRVSAFTNEEEEQVNMNAKVPFLLQSRLTELGARHEGGPAFQPHAVRDGRLITGQNPASSEQVTNLMLAALGEERQPDGAML